MTLSSKIMCAALVGLMASSAFAAKPWLDANEYANLHVVVAADASPSEHYATQVFLKYWQECTGFEPSASDQEVPGAVNVWIGRDGCRFVDDKDMAGLGDDGLVIRTVTVDGRYSIRQKYLRTPQGGAKSYKHLVIAGGKQRGAMYGAYQFFEDYMGVRWLAPDATHVPDPPATIPQIDFRYVPSFYYRDVSYRAFIQNPEYAIAHKLNGQHMSAIPEDKGGWLGYTEGYGGSHGFGHTFHNFISPAEYGQTHPEYFSEVNGKRMTGKTTQLCLTNPDVLDITIQKVREILRTSPPNRRIVSITQMDWGFWCECEECRAIDKREGTPMGSVLTFVNAVADAIADEFPDAYIDTFAYTYTRKPPKHIRPRDNVIIRLCSIECDFFKPLSDKTSMENRAFQRDIKAWSAITKNLFVWDYTQNWWCHQQPQPNFHVLQPNVKFYAEHGVDGLFEQSSPSSPHSDYEYLKGYILAKSVWNPDVDWRVCYNEFLDLYYGKVAPYIREYHQLITDKVRKDNYVLTFASRMEWMDYDTVEAAQTIFAEAFAQLNEKDAALRERLNYAYLPVQYAALVAYPKIEITDNAYILTRPPSQTFDEYWAMIMDYGVNRLEDRGIEELRERLNATTPPRYEEIPIEKLSNENYEVWVLPSLRGSIVRFRDKRHDIELLKGYKNIQADEGMWQEWDLMNPDAPAIEEAVARSLDVVARTDDSITLRTTLESGLVLERKMSLAPGEDALHVAMSLTNASDKPLVPRVKMHPEFLLEGTKAPSIWVERDGVWGPQDITYDEFQTAGAAFVEPDGVSRWALWMPQARAALVNRVTSDELQNLFYFYNRTKNQVNLELVPDQTPLQPGETRTLHADYAVTKRKPAKL